jgi:hypothetical protein
MSHPMLAVRCYVCGRGVGGEFVLVAMSDDVDRVFVAHGKCSQQMQDVRVLSVSIVS